MSEPNKHIAIIGAGFSGLSSAACLAQAGYKVTVYEQHSMPGGRARKWVKDGFSFDMGPSWVWMPDVFEKFFGLFGYSPSDFYTLKRLDPSYAIYFGPGQYQHISADLNKLTQWFDSLEPGAGVQLHKFLKEAKVKYNAGINDLVYKPGRSVFEFTNLKVMSGLLKMDLLKSFSSHIRQFFKHPRLLQFLEFPVLFLGALPENTPALYSLMNYADIVLGTYYPMGGMYKIVEAMEQVAKEQGAKFKYNSRIEAINVENGKATGLKINGESIAADVILAGADYHHVETKLLPPTYQSYKAKYWDTRVLAPSALIYYVGLNKKLKDVEHHTLMFDKPFRPHAQSIYETPDWPTDPSVYLSVTSQTDPSTAPPGHENLMILIPVAPNLEDSEKIREHYFNKAITRIENMISQNLTNHIVLKRSYAYTDFVRDYGALKGNAYGLANTLMQTALLKPSIKSKKVENLYYTGQLTVPGPGVPPTIISGQVVSKEIIKENPK